FVVYFLFVLFFVFAICFLHFLFFFFFFFFNDTATTEIYTLSLHDALPILEVHGRHKCRVRRAFQPRLGRRTRRRAHCDRRRLRRDRKSTRLNSSHVSISYAVFCLKKKKKKKNKKQTNTKNT